MIIRKIVAAVAALAVSSVCVTGFAAQVETTTTYNTDSGMVEVSTAVSGATSDSEIAFIVESGGKVVYVDQDTAQDGSVEFFYRIHKEEIAEDYTTSVEFGSSSETDDFSGTGVKDLGIVPLSQATEDAHYTITYENTYESNAVAWGLGEKVTATVVPDDGYEVTAIYINGEEQESVTTTVELEYNQVLTAKVQEVTVEAGLDYLLLDEEESDGLVSRIVILTPKGQIASAGVLYDGEYYPSLEKDVTKMSAVKIIFPTDETEFDLVGAYKLPESEEVHEGTPLSVSSTEVTE